MHGAGAGLALVPARGIVTPAAPRLDGTLLGDNTTLCLRNAFAVAR